MDLSMKRETVVYVLALAASLLVASCAAAPKDTTLKNAPVIEVPKDPMAESLGKLDLKLNSLKKDFPAFKSNDKYAKEPKIRFRPIGTIFPPAPTPKVVYKRGPGYVQRKADMKTKSSFETMTKTDSKGKPVTVSKVNGSPVVKKKYDEPSPATHYEAPVVEGYDPYLDDGLAFEGPQVGGYGLGAGTPFFQGF